MSVLARLRGESPTEYLITARELFKHNLKTCLNLPKRYTFYIGTKLQDIAELIFRNVVSGEKFSVQNSSERVKRRNNFIEAKSLLQVLADEISLISEIVQFSEKTIMTYMKLINKEDELLTKELEHLQ